jgi:lipid II:glycine glycyltransferase (peptidoglycan interpeptide bridge formation enzyme)
MSDLSMHEFQGSGSEWNALIADLPGAHLLQTWEWAELKAAFGWHMMPVYWGPRDPIEERAAFDVVHAQVAAAAMVLKRSILSRGFVKRLSVMYVPRGPLLSWSDEAVRDQVLDDLEGLARRQGAVLMKIDPNAVTGRKYAEQDSASADASGRVLRVELERRGWRFSNDQVQFRNTVVLDLSLDESDLLDRMKQKTRYNVRLAERKGVSVRSGSIADIPALYRMYAETSVRDGFVIRSEEYYRKAWSTFLRPYEAHDQPSAEVLVAEVQEQPVAALFLYYFARHAYYLYGMSVSAHRDKMPNHLLQWEAIRRARRHGCALYDLWGAPDEFDEADPMWGVYRFKEGLGGEVVRTVGAWDYPASALWYRAYTRLVPRILGIMRARGRRHVKDVLGGE